MFPPCPKKTSNNIETVLSTLSVGSTVDHQLIFWSFVFILNHWFYVVRNPEGLLPIFSKEKVEYPQNIQVFFVNFF